VVHGARVCVYPGSICLIKSLSYRVDCGRCGSGHIARHYFLLASTPVRLRQSAFGSALMARLVTFLRAPELPSSRAPELPSSEGSFFLREGNDERRRGRNGRGASSISAGRQCNRECVRRRERARDTRRRDARRCESRGREERFTNPFYISVLPSPTRSSSPRRCPSRLPRHSSASPSVESSADASTPRRRDMFGDSYDSSLSNES